ncbi:MAG TPA: hypothetical protein VKM93_00665 [Terriglobia bacterium]|nr:hypothetical protein [Terriglobia bacterium]
MSAYRCLGERPETRRFISRRQGPRRLILVTVALLSLAGVHSLLLAASPAGSGKSARAAGNQAAQNPPAPAQTQKPAAPAQPQNPPAAAPSESERPPVGALAAVGEVYINDAKVPQVATVFYGDTLRTSSGGATLNVVGKGVLSFSANTVVSFNEVEFSGYFMTLKQGSVSFHSFINVKNFETLVGNYVVSPDARAEAGAAVERQGDGSAHIQCTLGSVGVISSEGPESLYLNPGQEAYVLPDGKLTTNKPAPHVPAGSTQAPASSKTLWILLAGGGAAAAVVAVVASGGKSASPSNP